MKVCSLRLCELNIDDILHIAKVKINEYKKYNSNIFKHDLFATSNLIKNRIILFYICIHYSEILYSYILYKYTSLNI